MRIFVSRILGVLLLTSGMLPVVAQQNRSFVFTRFQCSVGGEPQHTLVQSLSSTGDAVGFTLFDLAAGLTTPGNARAFYWNALSRRCTDITPIIAGYNVGYSNAIATGVNRWGATVGYLVKDTGGPGEPPGLRTIGFLRTFSGLTSISHPNGPNTTRLTGITDDGEIVGFYVDGNSTSGYVERGFIRHSNGTFTNIAFVSLSATRIAPQSLNPNGVIAGWFANEPAGTPESRKGFMIVRNGTEVQIAQPAGCTNLELRQVSGATKAAAFCNSATPGEILSFVVSPKGGKSELVESPDAGSSIVVMGINDIGQIAGAILGGSPLKAEGFIRSPAPKGGGRR